MGAAVEGAAPWKGSKGKAEEGVKTGPAPGGRLGRRPSMAIVTGVMGGGGADRLRCIMEKIAPKAGNDLTKRSLRSRERSDLEVGQLEDTCSLFCVFEVASSGS
jgi:hypothetical protein